MTFLSCITLLFSISFNFLSLSPVFSLWTWWFSQVLILDPILESCGWYVYKPEEMELHISWPLKCNQSILRHRSFIILKLSFTDQWYFLKAPLRHCVHVYIHVHLYTCCQLWHIKTPVLLQSKLFVQFYPKICGKGDVACMAGVTN